LQSQHQIPPCADDLGDDFLARLRNHKVELCGSESLEGDSFFQILSMTRHLVHSTPLADHCGDMNAIAHLAVLDNASLSKNGITVEMKDHCHGESFSELEDIQGNMPVKVVPAGRGAVCDDWVKEDTIFVQDPRFEYFQNYYHSMEEVFSMFETAEVLGRSISDFRYLFTWGGEGGEDRFFQLQGQLEGAPEPQDTPPRALHQMLELWNNLASVTSGGQGAGRRKLRALPLKDVVAGRTLCFRRLVLPMRACSGSIVQLSWSEDAVTCGYGSPIARKVRGAILNAYREELPKQVASPPPKTITLISRVSPKRGLDNENEVKEALSRRLPGFHLQVVDLAKLSFAEQVKVVQQTQVLVGIHGAGLTHVVLLPDGAGVVEITPFPPPLSGRTVANIFSSLAAWSEHPYQAVQTTSGDIGSDVEVDPDAVVDAVIGVAGAKS